jgi:N-acetylmuramoyl-L-alanine amidase
MMTRCMRGLAGALLTGAAVTALAACGAVGAAHVAAAHPSSSGPAHAVRPSAGPSRPSRPGNGGDAALPLRGKIIVIDPGHNGQNWAYPGIINRLVNVITEWKPCDTTGTATDAGYTEHAFNFDVALRLVRLLRAEGATVVLTRTNDTGVGPCITQRAAIGNRAHAQAAISIHADGGPPGGAGFEVIEPGLVPGYNAKIIAPSQLLALDIRNAYHRITGEAYSDYVGHDGLDVRTDLGGLNLSTIPKVFIECGNMRNSGDAARLASAAFRQRIAVALAAGFTAYLTRRT